MPPLIDRRDEMRALKGALGRPASLSLGYGQRCGGKRIAPRLDDHMGPVFEQIVGQAIAGGALLDDVGPVDAMAPYWTRDGQTEIDWVVQAGEATVLVECTWRSTGRVGASVLGRLRGHAGRAPARLTRGARLCIASAGTFTDELRTLAEAEGVLLLDAARLLPG